MKVTVDRDKCAGLGLCEVAAPGYFELGEDGYSSARKDVVADADLTEVRAAISNCPMGALRLEAN